MDPMFDAIPPAADVIEPTSFEPGRVQPPANEGHGIMSRVVQAFRTTANFFGLSRLYDKEPPCVPESQLDSLDTVPNLCDIIDPYPNLSSFMYAQVFASFDRLSRTVRDSVRKVILHDSFRSDDLLGVNFDALEKKVLAESLPWGDPDLGWRNGCVKIKIPVSDKSTRTARSKPSSLDGGVEFQTDQFWHRPIVPLLKSILSSSASQSFTYEPYKQFWSRPESNDPPIRVYDELYTADKWLSEHEEIQNIQLPPEEPDLYPRAVAALMFWSDSTHLAEFGQAKAWPIYMALGNQSKFDRASSNTHALHHLAYLPSVSSQLQHSRQSITVFIYSYKKQLSNS